MRFTKIPLIATLMAVALSLLIVLPTLAQVSGDRTDGRLSVGDWIDVRVADSLTGDIGDTEAVVQTSSSYAVDGYEAKDTYFDGTLYISNKEKAYNTILITAKVRGDAGAAPLAKTNDSTTTPPVTDNPCAEGVSAAVARVRNVRSNTTVVAHLVDSGSGEDVNGTDVTIYHGIAAVWDQEASIEEQYGPCAAHGDPEQYAGSDEQTTEAQAHADYAAITTDNPTATTEEIEALQARFVANFEGDADNIDGWTANSAAVIPARDGDTIVVTVDGVSGSIRLVVDGDAPEIEDATPIASNPQKSTSVDLGFTVSDDGSGIRYDGESGSSTDVDLQPHNGDGDQRFDEPITIDPTEDPVVQHNGDGSTLDIQLYFAQEDDDYNPAALDDDGNRTEAPTTDPPTNTIEIDGTTYLVVDDTKPGKGAPKMDAVGLVKDRSAVWGDDTESSQYGSNGWTQETRGVEYSLDMRLVGKGFGTYHWQLTVKDRVGNSVTTDGDEDENGKQPYSFKVDDADPIVDVARTGIGYEPGKGEFTDRSWIALSFINEPADGRTSRGTDRIQSSSVQASGFTVEGHTVIDAIAPSDKPVCKDDDPETARQDESAKNIERYPERNASLSCEGFDPRTHVYLQLGDELGSDEEPTIQLLGGILQDIAGNNNATQSLDSEVQDWIAPRVTITITSNTGTTGRAATDNDGSFTVRVTSDEDLRRFPKLFFASIQAGAPYTDGFPAPKDLTIAGVTASSDGVPLVEKDVNNWEKKVNADSDDIPDSSAISGKEDRIVAAVITATDENGNSGNSAGWSDGDDGNGRPNVGEKLDFKKLDGGGFLLEIDNVAAAAEIEVLPSTNPGTVKNLTESMNPYIQILFSEQNEYGIVVTDNDGDLNNDGVQDEDEDPAGTYDAEEDTANSIDIGDGKKAKTDSHPGVTITALALDGKDMLAEVVQVEPYKYVLAVTGLEVGEHTITYAAHDDVGNEVDEDEAEFDFKVLERQPYEVTLQPGWNLISVPGDPFNPAVGSVIGADLKADTVLGYQNGEWVTSVRSDEGRWQGTLTDIQGGYGYWVRTTVIETIETVIPPTLPTTVLPTVPIIAGWNLVGVVDASQRAVDDGVGEDADEYLTSLKDQWRVAYSFETQLNRWEKLLPDPDNENLMLNGKGYWLWNTRPGTLVP